MAGYYDPQMYPDSTLTLISLNGTFTTKRVAVPEGQSILVGRLTDPHDVNYIPKFNSKVVSRNHAAFIQQGGKFYIKDVGSASGTFLQNPRFGDKPYRLSEQSKESALFELHDGDAVQLGADFEADGVMHYCVHFRVSLPMPATANAAFAAGYSSSPVIESEYSDGSFVDYSTDPDVKREVENEFNTIWSSLTSPLNIRNKLRASSLQGIQHAPSSPVSYGSPVSAPAPTSTPPPVASTPPPVASRPVATAAGAGAPAGANGDCVAFVRAIQWDTPAIAQKVVQLVEAGDSNILGYYRSLKQFPSAFKDVVLKHLKKTGDA